MKKQIAVLMAAATAVTTVAPAIASADVVKHNKMSVTEVQDQITKALAEKYTAKNEDGLTETINPVKEYMNARYAVVLATGEDLTAETEKYGLVAYTGSQYEASNIFAGVDDLGTLPNKYIVKDAVKVKPLLEKLMATPDEGKSVETKVFIADKGAVVVDNAVNAFRVTKNKHLVEGAVKDADTEVSIADLKAKFEAWATKYQNKEISFVKKVEDIPGGGFKVTLASDVELKFNLNDDAVDITKPLDKDGNTLNLKVGEPDVVNNNEQSVCNQVAKFVAIPNENDEEVKVDVANGDVHQYELNDVELSTFDLGTIYTKGEGYTQAGANLLNSLIRAKRDRRADFSFNYNGVNYMLATDKGKSVKYEPQMQAVVAPGPIGPIDDAVERAKKAVKTADAKIDKVGDHYELRVNVTVLDKNDRDRFKTLQFKFDGKSQEELARVLEDLKGDVEVVVGKFVKLAGPNRYETAIEVSKERFDCHTANTVVVVGADALMDGLAAAPLAAAKKAPLLLANAKTGLSGATLSEIQRATTDLKRKTVYIVGGENSVPKSVEKQLEDKFGAVVLRLSGDNRYDTSLEVASRLVTDNNSDRDMFVVGGDGAADAMSVSAVAASKRNSNRVSPILVVPQKGIKRTQREFIKAKKFEVGYLIGGEGTVSTQVFRDLEEAVKPNQNPQNTNVKDNIVERISGRDRYATNVAVVKHFYDVKRENNENAQPPVYKGLDVKGLDVTSGDNKYLVDAQTAGAFAAENGAPILLTGSSLTKGQKDLLADMSLRAGVYQVGGVVSSTVMKEVVEVLGL